MTTMNISLTPELAALIQQKVASGLYNNASEVIREALRQLDTNAKLLYEMKLARLKEALAPGLAQAKAGHSGEYSIEALIDELDGR